MKRRTKKELRERAAKKALLLCLLEEFSAELAPGRPVKLAPGSTLKLQVRKARRLHGVRTGLPMEVPEIMRPVWRGRPR